MWIRKQVIEDLLAAQRDTNATISSVTRSLTEQTRALELLADMVKRHESTSNTRLDGVERQLMQYAGASREMVDTTEKLVALKETIELRIAALQFSTNQLVKIGEERRLNAQVAEERVAQTREGEKAPGPGDASRKQHGRDK